MAMDLERVIEGQCPTCWTPLERRDDCGWCPFCHVGHSVAGDTYTLHLKPDTVALKTSLGGNTAVSGRFTSKPIAVKIMRNLSSGA